VGYKPLNRGKVTARQKRRIIRRSSEYKDVVTDTLIQIVQQSFLVFELDLIYLKQFDSRRD
jgi:hypothetical protein